MPCAITRVLRPFAPNARYLLAANFQNDSVSFIDICSIPSSKNSIFVPVVNPPEAGKPGGSYPYAIVATNTTAYVTSQRDRELVVLDISGLPSVRVITRIRLLGQPNKLILNYARTRLYVAFRTPHVAGRPQRSLPVAEQLAQS